MEGFAEIFDWDEAKYSDDTGFLYKKLDIVYPSGLNLGFQLQISFNPELGLKLFASFLNPKIKPTMIKKICTGLVGSLFLVGLINPLSAQFQLPSDLVYLHNWQFNEVAGTELTGAVDSAGGALFDGDINNSTTTGDGSFRVERSGSPYAAWAPMNLPTSGKVYLGVDLAAWNANAAGTSQARFGFHNNTTDAGGAGQMIAEINFERQVDKVALALFTTGDDGVSLSRTVVSDIPVSSTDPIRLVMEYDLDALEARLYYSLAGSAFSQFLDGTAIVDPARSGSGVGDHYLRLSFFGNAASGTGGFDNGQSIDIDGIFVAIPEPSTYALLAGIGILGLAIWHRRRS
ncbi:MAG TPA: PEP-CTERM sorting domain-containing protein [Opitutales bacterium]|nr:PEP-CTERM sorting domain-containing protein [Opitutales bacterium]